MQWYTLVKSSPILSDCISSQFLRKNRSEIEFTVTNEDLCLELFLSLEYFAFYALKFQLEFVAEIVTKIIQKYISTNFAISMNGTFVLSFKSTLIL